MNACILELLLNLQPASIGEGSPSCPYIITFAGYTAVLMGDLSVSWIVPMMLCKKQILSIVYISLGCLIEGPRQEKMCNSYAYMMLT